MLKLKLRNLILFELLSLLVLSMIIGVILFVSDLSSFWRERFSLDSGLIRQTYFDHRSELLSGNTDAFESTLATMAKAYGIKALEIEYNKDHSVRLRAADNEKLSPPLNAQNCRRPGFQTLLSGRIACFSTEFGSLDTPPLIKVRWWVLPEGLERQTRGAILLFSSALLFGLALCVLHWWLIKRVIVAPVLQAVASFERWVRTEGAGCAPPSRFKFHTAEIADLIRHFDQLLAVAQDYRQMRDVAIQLEAIDLIAKQVSHDLRSPLSAMRVAVEKLSKSPSSEARALALSSFQRVNDILATLGRTSRGASERAALAQGTTPAHSEDILCIVESIVAEHQILVNPERTTLRLECEEGLELFALVDGVDLRRALSNLINNALEALPESKGHVTVQVQASAKDIQISIEDDGIGIPTGVLDRLGERGVTLGKAHLQNSGEGLGVFQAKKAVEACGGSISFTSRLGRGTRVSIRIPASAPPPYWASAIPAAARVVVVDDDIQMHRLWREKFFGLSCELKCFLSATDFEDWATANQSEPVSTVYLLDFSLGPHQPSGFELVERNQLVPARVTIVTAIAGNPDLQQQAERLGVTLMSKQAVPFKAVVPCEPLGLWNAPPISS